MVTEALNRKVVRVPDVVGRPLEKARILLEDSGLPQIVILYRESYEDRDTVLEQRPARGQMVYETTEVTIWVARRGYLEHLPAIYRRSDAVGRNLVRELCFVFEHMFDSVEQNLTDGWRFYDPHVAPPEFLEWLSKWTAFTTDLDWPEEQRRALIKRAVDLYRIRGTRKGLALFLKLFTGHEPDIEENKWPFKGFRVEGEGAEQGARIALDTVILPPVDVAHCFVVTMPIKFEDVTTEMVIRIHQIIQLEKPAHTHYYLKFLEEKGETELREFFAIGLRSGIGIGAEVVQESGEEKP
ncbi:MAG: PASTA domain-containing protein [Kofleriaceae bacterium]|nr:PASTA domain-containing protein [Kofleriaceae bacterium]